MAADEFASPDLEILAAQLRDDAAYLTRLYPARHDAARLLEQRRTQRWPARAGWRVAAAVLLLAGAGSTFAWLEARSSALRQSVALESGAGQTGAAAGTEASPVVALERELKSLAPPVAPREVALTATADETPLFSTESDIADLEPGDLLQELSASEQEAMFDLLETEPIELARVSL